VRLGRHLAHANGVTGEGLGLLEGGLGCRLA
jgi:hypothetical protein